MKKIIKTEKEITKHWTGNLEKPIVSICCATYNHENFISTTLDSFLIQKTKYSFEIIIRDDASTDLTTKIIKEYEKRYPNIIKPIYENENQYSKGIKPSIILLKQTAGKYIAFCDGDDYWTDECKLQIQVDEMKKNPNINLCFHPSQKIDYLNNENEIIGNYNKKTSIIPFESILTRPYGIIPTASMLFKSNIIDKYLQFMNKNKYLTQGDIVLQMISSFDAGAIFINKIMSVYRYQTEGSWTKKYEVNDSFTIKVLLSKIQYYLAFYQFIRKDKDKLILNLIMGVVCQLSILLNNINHKHKEYITNILVKIFKNNLLENNLYSTSIILYGASTFTVWFMDNFPNVNILYILDSDIKKHNTLCNTVKVQHPSKIKYKNENIFITLIGREYQIAKELENEYNFDKEFIHIVDNINFDDFRHIPKKIQEINNGE